MHNVKLLHKIGINVKAHKLLRRLLRENSTLERIMRDAKNETEALIGVRNWVYDSLSEQARDFYEGHKTGREGYEVLQWRDLAAIRILDYVDNAGRKFQDQNLRGKIAYSNPIKLIWLAVNRGTGGAKPDFFEDMLHLFRQFSGRSQRKLPGRKHLEKWMKRWPSGLDPRIVKLREENRERIIKKLIEKIDNGEIKSERFKFPEGYSPEQKFLLMLDWWKDKSFHLQFAVRDSEDLNDLLGKSLDPDMKKILADAEEKGIPIFVNPYYLSLLQVRVPYYAIGADLAIRDYVLYSRQLVEEFGHIVAWEKEDEVKPGEPNAAGWILPSHHNVHRRYPDVAILIPETVGRACGGLCASCQRMYDFQSGHLNFNLDKLKPKTTWSEQLRKYMDYFENDAQLRDILITGGDALMSSDESLRKLLDAVYRMAVRKREANEKRQEDEKFAEMLRVRLGTRLPVYLPMRITPDLTKILADFKEKASKIGIKQFVIQTHFESPMEVTPEARDGIERLLSAGWTVTNQLVFTAAASRRGHTAKLRRVLNNIGVLTYYTFTCKGYMENNHNFAPNARAVQEQVEEKVFGQVPEKHQERIHEFPLDAENMVENISTLRDEEDLPFLATDRNVLNLPGVGKSLSFRVVGITRYGRRILEFDHDPTRAHSPIIDKMGKVVIVESKSITDYMRQLDAMGEDVGEYESLFGYSMGETESRAAVYEYPEYDFTVTGALTNIDANLVPEKVVEEMREPVKA